MPSYCVGPVMAIDWEAEDKPADRRVTLRRVFAYFAPYWRKGLINLACIGAAAALGLVPAVVLRASLDYLTKPGGQLGHFMLIIAGGVAASLAGGLIGVGESYLENVISQGIMFDVRNQLFERLVRQSVGFFTSSRAGEVMSRVSNDVNGIQDVVSDTIFGLVSSVFVLAGTLAVMVSFDWRLTLLALALLPAVILPGRKVGRATYEARKRTQDKMSEITAYMQEILGISGILLVKAFVKERAEQRRFWQVNDELRSLEIRQMMIGRWFQLLMNLVQTIAPALFWILGGYLVLSGRASVGTVVTFVTMLGMRLAGSVGRLGNLQVNVTGSMALFERIFHYIDMPAEVADTPGARSLGHLEGAVTFDDVSFSYKPGAQPALANVSLQVEPGQLVALVGPSGAGKTTMTYLLSRFYDPSIGSVRVDGTDLRDVTLESLGQNIGMVFQDTFLFHTTVRDNLLYARPEATQADIEAATRAAYIHDFIQSLPEGYDTLVGERGHRLSGGEKQRLALARVILKDPRILILDEATSNLDTLSEQLIQAALKPLFAGRTSFVIAHRLSTVLAADVILVFNQGRLTERGRHSELVRRDGLYTALYERQFAAGRQRPAEFTVAT